MTSFFPIYLNSLQSSNEIDSIVLLESLLCAIWGIILVFITCEISQRFSNTFTDLYETVCQLEWYLYPVEVQQIFVLLILYAQKPCEIPFFGSYACSREQFKRVKYYVKLIREYHWLALNKLSITFRCCFRWPIKYIPISWYFVNCTVEVVGIDYSHHFYYTLSFFLQTA